MARKSSKQTAVIESGLLYTDDQWNGARVGDLTFLFWLKLGKTFYFDDSAGTFTGRAEMRGHDFSWYAFRKIGGKLQKRYIGRSPAIEMQRLREVAASF